MTGWQDLGGAPVGQAGGGRRRRARIAAGVAGMLVLLAVVVVGANAIIPVRPEVAPRTTVAGVDVGGMSRVQVRDTVNGPVTQAVGRTVRLTIADDVLDVPPAGAGIRLDRPATERALLRTGPDSLFDRWRQGRGTGRQTVDPVFTVDEKAATAYLTAKLEPLQRNASNAKLQVAAPQPALTAQGNASFSATPAQVTVTPGQTGQKVDVATVLTALRKAVERQRAAVTVDAQVTRPALDTDAARRVDQLIGTFTTMHPCCAPRVTNIHRIAQLVDGTVVEPGETFSLNGKVGPRTTENGFVSAPAIAEGEEVDQVGGGVSQFSTTLFNATWFAGLDLVTHTPHSEYFSRYPPGREATLDYDSIDQKFRNDTDAPVLIRTSTTGTSVTVALYGHTGERVVTSTTGPRIPLSDGGFEIGVDRMVRDAGAEVARDRAYARYRGDR